MTLGREKLDVYGLSIGSVAWGYEIAAGLYGVERPPRDHYPVRDHCMARDQWLRASSQSIPLNNAEGNGETAEADRRRYLMAPSEAGGADG